MKLKKILFGETNYDEKSPESQQKYNRAKQAGVKFSQWLRIDKASAWLTKQALQKPKVFFGCIFGIIFLLFANVAVSMFFTISQGPTNHPSAVHAQERKIEKALSEKKERQAKALDSLNIIPPELDSAAAIESSNQNNL